MIRWPHQGVETIDTAKQWRRRFRRSLIGRPSARRTRESAFIFLVVLLLLSAAATLTSVGLTRAMVAIMVARRVVADQQAFHLADAGIEAVLFEEQNAATPWTWFTHDATGTPIDPPPVVLLDGDPLNDDPQCSIACIQSNAYQIALPLGSASVQVQPLADGAIQVTSSGTVASIVMTRQLTVVLRPMNLAEFFFLSPQPTSLSYGQKVTLDAGPGRFYVDGWLRIGTGSGGGINRDVEMTLSELMVTQEVKRRPGNGTSEWDLKWRRPTDPAGQFNTMPIPSAYFGTQTMDVSGNPILDGSGNPTPDPRWDDWLNTGLVGPQPGLTPRHGSNVWSPQLLDLRGVVKDKLTGALPQAQVVPNLPDIDSMVQNLKPIADYVIDLSGEVPCAAGGEAQFANATQLKMVQVIEIDVSSLNGCLAGPTALYVNAPVRLTNGAELAQPLTVVSPDSIYVKGNYNTVNTKSAAIVTGNHTYYLSNAFKDYTQFVTPWPGYSLGQTMSWWDYGQAGLNAYRNNYDVNTTVPPWPKFANYYATETEQHMMIIAPMGTPATRPAGDTRPTNAADRLLHAGLSLIEPWFQCCGWDATTSVPPYPQTIDPNRKFIHLIGSFVSLPDSDPDHLDPSYQANADQDVWPKNPIGPMTSSTG